MPLDSWSLIRVTLPLAPFSSTRSPSFSQLVSPGIETMVGRPISLATMAEWDSILPRSTNSPVAAGKIITQPGSVRCATTMVPGAILASRGSSIECYRPAHDSGTAADTLQRLARTRHPSTLGAAN